jgi:hypothetical protein
MNRLNDDGTVTIDQEVMVRINDTVDPRKLRMQRDGLKKQIQQMLDALPKMRAQLQAVKAQIQLCVAAGAPADPGDAE